MSATGIVQAEVYRAVERGYQRMFDEIAGLTESVYDRELYEIALAELKKRDIEQRFEGWFWGG